jgi:hypothetical protein
MLKKARGSIFKNPKIYVENIFSYFKSENVFSTYSSRLQILQLNYNKKQPQTPINNQKQRKHINKTNT